MGCAQVKQSKQTPFDSFHVPSHVLEVAEDMCTRLRHLDVGERVNLGADTSLIISNYVEKGGPNCFNVAEIFQRFLNYTTNKQFSIVKSEVVKDGNFHVVLLDVNKPMAIYVVFSLQNENNVKEVFLQAVEPSMDTLASYRVALSNIIALKPI
jgi:hypothetical protein